MEEAAALPALARYAAESPPTSAVGSTTYEDLLATAILNKVIITYIYIMTTETNDHV